MTLHLAHTNSNPRLGQLASQYDIIAVRPMTEKALKHTCDSLDVDIISLDLSMRHSYPFRHGTFSSAIARGIKIELCYGSALQGDPTIKRTVIDNMVQLIRATRGRGLVLSSDAKSVLGIRAPSDIINLADVWGLRRDKSKDAMTKEPARCVEHARLKRDSFRGAVDIVFGGEQPTDKGKGQNKKDQGASEGQMNKKRKADEAEKVDEKPLSKREMKRRKKQAQREGEISAGHTTTNLPHGQHG